MKDQATPILNAASEARHLRDLENMIAMMRMTFAPLLNAHIDCIDEVQSKLISAGSIFAGQTVGHMLAVGALDATKGDTEQAKLVAMHCFDIGVEQGRAEALGIMAKTKGVRA